MQVYNSTYVRTCFSLDWPIEDQSLSLILSALVYSAGQTQQKIFYSYKDGPKHKIMLDFSQIKMTIKGFAQQPKAIKIF